MSKKAVDFEVFACLCPYINRDTDVNNGYGCKHPKQENVDKDGNGKEQGCCYCFSCPLGAIAKQEDLAADENGVVPDIDWDGFECEGEIPEDSLILVDTSPDASYDEKKALFNYEAYFNRYDDEWKKENEDRIRQYQD